jgi:hypothetical protein
MIELAVYKARMTLLVNVANSIVIMLRDNSEYGPRCQPC